MVGRQGLEPWTVGLKVRCSTNCANRPTKGPGLFNMPFSLVKHCSIFGPVAAEPLQIRLKRCLAGDGLLASKRVPYGAQRLLDRFGQSRPQVKQLVAETPGTRLLVREVRVRRAI